MFNLKSDALRAACLNLNVQTLLPLNGSILPKCFQLAMLEQKKTSVGLEEHIISSVHVLALQVRSR